jgi:hypothetical protein
METLLKGSFSLLAIINPHVALRVSACNIKLFLEILNISLTNKDLIDFKKAFNFLFETIRGLLIYAKEGKFDVMFLEQGLLS